MPREATLPPRVVNVPGDYFSMAGFEVTLYGRFWVTPEARTGLRVVWNAQVMSQNGVRCLRRDLKTLTMKTKKNTLWS